MRGPLALSVTVREGGAKGSRPGQPKRRQPFVQHSLAEGEPIGNDSESDSEDPDLGEVMERTMRVVDNLHLQFINSTPPTQIHPGFINWECMLSWGIALWR